MSNFILSFLFQKKTELIIGIRIIPLNMREIEIVIITHSNVYEFLPLGHIGRHKPRSLHDINRIDNNRISFSFKQIMNG